MSQVVQTNRQLCTAFANPVFINVVVTPTCFDGQATIFRGHLRLEVHYASQVVTPRGDGGLTIETRSGYDDINKHRICESSA